MKNAKAAGVNDRAGLPDVDYADGRPLAIFYCLEDVQANEKQMQQVIKKWMDPVE